MSWLAHQGFSGVNTSSSSSITPEDQWKQSCSATHFCAWNQNNLSFAQDWSLRTLQPLIESKATHHQQVRLADRGWPQVSCSQTRHATDPIVHRIHQVLINVAQSTIHEAQIAQPEKVGSYVWIICHTIFVCMTLWWMVDQWENRRIVLGNGRFGEKVS